MDMIFAHQSIVVPSLRRVQSTHDGIKIPNPAASALCYFKDDLTNSGCIVIDVSFTQIAVIGHREQYGGTGDGLFHRVEQLQVFTSIGFSIKCTGIAFIGANGDDYPVGIQGCKLTGKKSAAQIGFQHSTVHPDGIIDNSGIVILQAYSV